MSAPAKAKACVKKVNILSTVLSSSNKKKQKKLSVTIAQEPNLQKNLMMMTKASESIGSGSAATPGSDVANREWRFVMPFLRKIYKSFKFRGNSRSTSLIYDFAKPFASHVNQKGASHILAAARQMPQWKLWDKATISRLHPEGTLSLYKYYSDNVRHNRRTQKLLRRQRAYDVILASASADEPLADEATKYNVVLTREFTSSDEEIDEDANNSDNEGGADGLCRQQCPWLRVRSLTWESAEVGSIKQHLDDIFQGQLATSRQRLQFMRYKRDGVVASQRTKPCCVPEWAVM